MIPTQKTPSGKSRTRVISLAGAFAVMVAVAAAFVPVHAQNAPRISNPRVVLPLVQCWYKGQVAYYIQTEASDAGLAQQQGVNYVPRLANVITADAVDDIYHVTNFTQGNVIPSAPIPAGPGNTDPAYSPLWQVSLVTWN